MPEGDSVLQLSNRLQFMTGREVTGCSVRVPRYATVHLDGMVCERVWPYGKHLFMQFDQTIVHTHLKMEGTWAIHYAGDRWRKPGHTARIVLQLANSPRDIEVVGHQLGFVDIYPADHYHQRIAHLGPDILDPDWDREEALRRLNSRPQRAIGAALLDQKVVAGIGNEYRAEACFLAGVHPATPVAEVDTARILDISRRIMWANRTSPVRVTTGVRRAGETTYVFGRNRKRCRRCGTFITKGALGGVDQGGDEGELERIIWWCPHCQPLHPAQ
ncbi:Fpg/Nei family DNA glycosylase [Corynebacterium marquesiae]|uniref:Fpg/Nei family DNA glycosylase n=1 Tax=Corynebacterium marquesiae TaxID=2913503 RepID=UPI0018E1C3F4|nr:Fpg/Nei family DNA glycosylase [Corynebacterium tuberculostearicum]